MGSPSRIQTNRNKEFAEILLNRLHTSSKKLMRARKNSYELDNLLRAQYFFTSSIICYTPPARDWDKWFFRASVHRGRKIEVSQTRACGQYELEKNSYELDKHIEMIAPSWMMCPLFVGLIVDGVTDRWIATFRNLPKRTVESQSTPKKCKGDYCCCARSST